VLARLVEVISGKSFAEFTLDRIFTPLGMVDTGFYVPEDKAGRLTALYGYDGAGKLELLEAPQARERLSPPTLTIGGGNLLSTAFDYMRFSQMLLNGGELAGVRLLIRKTVAFMTTNHLPREILPISASPTESWPEYGYGLGVAILESPTRSQIVGSPCEFTWQGYWSTFFWVDPVEELIGIFMTQVGPPFCWPNTIPPDFKVLVSQAVVD
jgi:CubicO group peptidase (beta-lactamase class C family)